MAFQAQARQVAPLGAQPGAAFQLPGAADFGRPELPGAGHGPCEGLGAGDNRGQKEPGGGGSLGERINWLG